MRGTFCIVLGWRPCATTGFHLVWPRAAIASNLVAMVSTLHPRVACAQVASTVVAMASHPLTLVEVAGKLAAMVSNLVAMASTLVAMASNLLAMASLRVAMASALP